MITALRSGHGSRAPTFGDVGACVALRYREWMVTFDETRVLVVDDDPRLRAAMSRALRKAGVVVDEAGTGAEALALLVRSMFAVVVSDVVMPGMTGIELVASMAEHQIETPLVLVTGCDLGEVRRAVGDSQIVDSVLAKPFVPRDLVATIRRLTRP